MQEQPSSPGPRPKAAPDAERADLKAELAKLALEAPPEPLHAGARLRNYFLTGLVVVGPVTITLYIAWYFINIVDAWVKPYIPRIYNPDTYLPFPIPGRGPVVRHRRPDAHRRAGRQPAGPLADQRRRADARAHADRAQRLQRPEADLRIGGDGLGAEPELPEGGADGVSLQGHLVDRVRHRRGGRARSPTEFPARTSISVFMPTGMLPPSGFVCFVPRKSVVPMRMSVEDAAKIIISAGMVNPETQARLKDMASRMRNGGKPAETAPPRRAHGATRLSRTRDGRLYAARNRRTASSHSKR